jgi:hypothetical protein
MTSRLTALTLALSLAAGGCVTTTAHKLVLTDNPLRDQAIACEKECRWFGRPAHGCEQTPGHEGCTVGRGESEYAACLDTCPGAVAVDDGACPAPAARDVICVETARANRAAIGGGALGVGGIAGTVLIVSAIATTPWWLLFLFLAL